MGDNDFPDLPSDEELGISEEDRKAYEEEFGDADSAMDPELAALLGESPKPKSAPPSAPPSGGAKTAEEPKPTAGKPDAKAVKKAQREAKKREKEERKRLKREQKEAKKREAAARKAGGDDAGSKEAAAEKPKAPKEEEGPRGKWRGAATLAALVATSLVASAQTGLPSAVPANAPDEVFSSSRAMSTLIEIAREAHPTGSPEHTRVREVLVDRLSALGLEPEVQTATIDRRFGDRLRVGTVRNVIARIPGTDPTGAVLLTAHYDGRGISVAAADDGSGVVSILEAARALLEGEPLRNDLIILITDAEELGLLGARAFVDQHEWIDDVEIVLSFEMMGSGGPSIMFETNELNGYVTEALESATVPPVTNSVAFEVYERLPRDTDFTPFKEVGKQGLNYAAIGNTHVYHQVYDRPENLSERTLQHHGEQVLWAAEHFGNADLTEVIAPDRVYFSVPFLGVVTYPAAFVLPLSGLVLGLLVLVLVMAKGAALGVGRVGTGLLVAVAGWALSFAGAYALLGWIGRFHPEAGAFHATRYHTEGWYALSLAGIALGVVTLLHVVGRRWLGWRELAVGGVILPAVLAVVLSFAAPLGAMNFQIPAISALVATCALLALGSRADGTLGATVAVLGAIPVLVILVPIVELIRIALTIEMGTYLTIVVAMMLQMMVPALESLRHPKVWTGPAIGAVTAAAALGLGLLLSRPNADRPMPSTLVYAYEHGTGTAIWATDPGTDSLDAEAVAWAMDRAGGSFDGLRDLTGFGYNFGQVPTATGPVVSAAPPEVVIASDEIVEGTRTVQLLVRSRIGAEMLAFTPDERDVATIVSVNGVQVEDDVEWIEHWGVPEGAVTVDVRMPATEPIAIHVVEHLLRPTELLGEQAFERPEDLAPDITRDSDRAMFRYSVGAFVDPRHSIRVPTTLPPAAMQGPAGGDGNQTDDAAQAPDTAVVDSVTVPTDTSLVVDTSTAVDTTAAQPDTGSVGRPSGR